MTQQTSENQVKRCRGFSSLEWLEFLICEWSECWPSWARFLIQNTYLWGFPLASPLVSKLNSHLCIQFVALPMRCHAHNTAISQHIPDNMAFSGRSRALLTLLESVIHPSERNTFFRKLLAMLSKTFVIYQISVSYFLILKTISNWKFIFNSSFLSRDLQQHFATWIPSWSHYSLLQLQ